MLISAEGAKWVSFLGAYFALSALCNQTARCPWAAGPGFAFRAFGALLKQIVEARRGNQL